MTSIQSGWEKIFRHFDVPRRIMATGMFELSADEIKQYSEGLEPRLMTKFDDRSSRPRLLQDNGITILPIRNGRYALVACDGYHDFDQVALPTPYRNVGAENIKTIPWFQFNSESQIIDAAFISSILKTFTQESEMFLTIRGRRRSPEFGYSINTNHGMKHFNVSGVQIEVDAGYEGSKIFVIEAKLGIRKDFIIRQLYYPFRMWNSLGLGKEVVPILLTYSNRVFSLRKYRFNDLNQYDSIYLEDKSDYIFEEPSEPKSIAQILERRQMKTPLVGIPFPQADTIQTVLDLIELISTGPVSRDEIAEKFEFDVRQSDYYGNAAAYLGLALHKDSSFAPTEDTRNFVQKNRTERIIDIVTRIAELPVFNKVLEDAASGTSTPKSKIAELIEQHTTYRGDTAIRRALTVESWIKWALSELPLQ